MLFRLVAIFSMIAFYTLYFGKMRAQKARGIQTDQLGKGKKGFVKFVEVGLKTSSYVLPVAELTSIFGGVSGMPLVIRIFGLVLCPLGPLMFGLAIFEMQDNWRAGVPEGEKTELVTTGVYRFSRNPAFLGFDLLYVGVLCAFFSIPLLIMTVVTMLFLHLQIVNVEEEFLITSFGQEYLDYRNRVGRYFGVRRTGSN